MPAAASQPAAGSATSDAAEPAAPAASPVLVAVCALAVVLGVIGRFVAPTPMWLDEALSVDIASLPLGDLLGALGHDGHPPLYYVLLHGWMRLVGDGDVAVRSLSGVLSVAALPLVYVAGRRRGGTQLGVVAVAVLALSPFALRYATEARMYSLVVLLVLAGWLLVDDLVAGRPVGWRVVVLAVVSGALGLTHYWALPLLGAAAVVLAVTRWRLPADDERRPRLVLAIAGLALGGVLFVPWIPTFLDQLGHTGTPWAPPTRPTAAVGAIVRDLAGGTIDDGVLAAVLLGALALVGLTGRPRGPWRIDLDLRTVPTVRIEAAVAALTLAAGTTVAYVAGATVVTRYAAVVLPLVVLVVAAGIACVAPRSAQVVVLVALVALGAAGVADELGGQRSQAGEAASAVSARLDEPRAGQASEAVVVTCPDQLGPAVARALWGPPAGGGPPRIVAYPGLDDPRLVDWYDYADRVAAADPGLAAQEVLDATPPSASIFLVWHSSYRLFEGRCEALRAGLAAGRPGAEDLVRADGDEFFEPATVTWFPPVSP